MAVQLPSPPSSRLTSPEPSPEFQTDTESLSSRLDALLIEYLSLLDTYTTLRVQLSKDFSSGFFTLAQANRNATSTLGAGRRYGEEGYDERMKAGRIISIEHRRRSHTSEGGQNDELKTENEAKKQEEEEPQEQQSSRIEAPEGTASDLVETDKQEGSSTYTYSLIPSSTSTKDPLKWYGILIPPALRTCQTHFTSAISSAVPELLNTTSKMGRVEEDIWKLRRELGVIDEYSRPKDATIQPGDATGAGHEPEIPIASLSSSPASSEAQPAKKSSGILSTSPASVGLPLEPRSRILKLG